MLRLNLMVLLGTAVSVTGTRCGPGEWHKASRNFATDLPGFHDGSVRYNSGNAAIQAAGRRCRDLCEKTPTCYFSFFKAASKFNSGNCYLTTKAHFDRYGVDNGSSATIAYFCPPANPTPAPTATESPTPAPSVYPTSSPTVTLDEVEGIKQCCAKSVPIQTILPGLTCNDVRSKTDDDLKSNINDASMTIPQIIEWLQTQKCLHTSSPTHVCKRTTCRYSKIKHNGVSYWHTLVAGDKNHMEHYHCEKHIHDGDKCECLCNDEFSCTIVHHFKNGRTDGKIAPMAITQANCAPPGPTNTPTTAPTPAPTPTPTAYPTYYPTPFPTPHPCDDGSHGCDKSANGICYKAGGNDWTCGCESGYHCTHGCSAPHSGHTCTRVTPSPTPFPTSVPTKAPTVNTPAPKCEDVVRGGGVSGLQSEHKMDGDSVGAVGSFGTSFGSGKTTVDDGKHGTAVRFHGGERSEIHAHGRISETNFGVSLWFRTSMSGKGGLFSIDDTTGSNDRHLYLNGGIIYVRTWPHGTAHGGSGLADSHWHHVVYSVGPSGENIFVDGSRVSHREDVKQSNYDWDQSAWIGWGSDAGYFSGDIDHLLIFNHEVDASEVQKLYTCVD